MTAKKDYHLTVPPDARCFVPGCDHPPTRILNLRIRTIDTGASYGPNIDGSWLCTRHGDSGAVVGIDYEPTTSGDVVTIVTHGGGVVTRTRRQIGNHHPGQDGLF